jgi:hypothetical protein
MEKEREASLIGKYLLAGVSCFDHDEKIVEQRQFHGVIVRINEHEGIVVRLSDSGEEWALPPDLDSLQEAPAGEYRLCTTGEIVINPDLLASWTVVKPKPEV